MHKIVECVMNVSEGRDPERLEKIAAAIRDSPRANLLDWSSDFDHHRSVFTFIGTPRSILNAAWAAIERVVQLVDLRRHRGVHPRIGAVDVVPFVPIRNVTMGECGELAAILGERVADQLDIPVYLYGEAARMPERRDLANIRRGQFEGLREAIRSDPSRKPDFGPSRLHPSAGACVIGARFLLIAFNVFLRSPDLKAAAEIARRVRESSGGLPSVKALGFRIEQRGQAQVSMNLTDYRVTSLQAAFRRVRKEARRLGLEVDSSQIVGLVPQAALPARPVEQLLLEDFNPSRILENRIREALTRISHTPP